MTRFLSRRQALRSVLAAQASAVFAERAHAAEATPAAADQPPGQCRLLPQAVEGPYYFDPKLVRSDIAEGRPGIRLRLDLRIIESGTHDELLAKSGPYSRLFKLQFSKYAEQDDALARAI